MQSFKLWTEKWTTKKPPPNHLSRLAPYAVKKQEYFLFKGRQISSQTRQMMAAAQTEVTTHNQTTTEQWRISAPLFSPFENMLDGWLHGWICMPFRIYIGGGGGGFVAFIIFIFIFIAVVVVVVLKRHIVTTCKLVESTLQHFMIISTKHFCLLCPPIEFLRHIPRSALKQHTMGTKYHPHHSAFIIGGGVIVCFILCLFHRFQIDGLPQVVIRLIWMHAYPYSNNNKRQWKFKEYFCWFFFCLHLYCG